MKLPQGRSRAAALIAAGVLAGAWGRMAEAQTRDRPRLRAGALAEELVLDGQMREHVWATADSALLTEYEPAQGVIPAERTVVKVLANPDVLVFGIRCDDPDPPHITSFARTRDADLSTEDHVRIVLDPFLNGQSGYVFAVNPNGARYDALISELAQRLGGRENPNWDTIWEAAAARSERGWSVEIRIPVKSLLFRPGLTTWGFNVQRRVQRKLETQRWAYASRDWRITQMSRAGLLVDLPTFSLDRGLSVRPAVVTGASIPAPSAPLTSNVAGSLDVTQRLGANTLAFLTVHTDFAETEVDQRRTNTTRFPLFYPEKRWFFLEATDIFDFGPGIAPDVMPFWSRRIGLYNGVPVPIDVGTKESGRVGAMSFGVLAVHTGAVPALLPAADMGVVRVKQNVLEESSVGAIATVGDPTGAPGSWLTGGDVLLQTSHLFGNKNGQLGLWGLTTDGPNLTGCKTAGGVSLFYPNAAWNNFLGYRRVGDGFQPALGFVPRPGVQQVNIAFNYFPRPTAPGLSRWLYEAVFEAVGVETMDLSGRWQTLWGRFTPLNLVFQSGDRIAAAAHPEAERLDAPFAIAPGDTIPTGAYRFLRYRLDYVRAEKRRISWWLTYLGGGFYNGHIDEYIGTMAIKPSPLVIVELSGERDQGWVVPGSTASRTPFVLERYGTRLRVATSPDFEVNAFTQYDNSSRQLGTDLRVRWTFRPSGDFFLTYTHNVAVPLGGQPWSFDSNRLATKLQYTFRY
ncbi:MAG TPA: carbohydrate binding family 9 domain-containing protein [Gemmatimonadales bacterium]|nr:carbohydrate binding family 9 domain-containing protein [Gemmatimonadales bacterium]